MNILIGLPLTMVADASAASESIRNYLMPILAVLVGLAGLACTFFLVVGGIHYMTSSGQPDKLDNAKKIIKNALIGLVIVIAAGTLTAILTNAYHVAGGNPTEQLPALTQLKPADTSPGLVDVLIKAITGLLQYVIESAAKPFIAALDYFTKATPLMAANHSVFNLWLAIVGIADVLFILVVALLGFHIMSGAALGLDEIEFKHLLPQLALIFLLMNTSIFAIDMVIGLSNALINAINAAFPVQSIWKVLSDVTSLSVGMGLVSLLIMVAFMVLAVILMVYYVVRLVTLYIGAVLAPLVILIWLLPSFKDFAATAVKTYVTTIFVLFVHVLILMLAASILGGMVNGSADNTLNPLMATIVGCATLVALLRTQGLMNQLAYVSMGPKAMRKLGSQFMTSVSYITKQARSVTPKRTPVKEEA